MKKRELSKEEKEKFPVLAHLGVYSGDDCNDDLDKLLKLDLDSTKTIEFSDSENLSNKELNSKSKTGITSTSDSEYSIDGFFNKGVDI